MAPDLNKVKDSAASTFDILDTKPKIDSSSEEGTTLGSVGGEIELRNVSFRYPWRPDIQILRDFCLTIPSGKTVALVGESGCGKSTVISLTTITGADAIAVVKNGGICEKGRHEALMRIEDGVYASLVALHATSR